MYYTFVKVRAYKVIQYDHDSHGKGMQSCAKQLSKNQARPDPLPLSSNVTMIASFFFLNFIFLENIYSSFCSAPGVCRMMGYKYHPAIPASPYLYTHSYKHRYT